MQDVELRAKELEDKISLEKKNIDEQAMGKQQQLTQEVEKLQNLLQNERNSKVEQEKMFQSEMEKFKEYPKLDQFITEALEMNKLLSQQLNEFCLKLTQIEPLYEITSSLIDKSVTLRQEIEDADDKIFEFLSWQDTEQGRKANLPRIEERHKEILFMEWEQQLMKSERAISRAKCLMNNATQLINDRFYATNLISDCTLGELPKVKEANSRWKEEIINKNQTD